MLLELVEATFTFAHECTQSRDYPGAEANPDGLTDFGDAVSEAAAALFAHMNAPLNEVIKLFLKNHCQFCDAHRFKSMRRYRADSHSADILRSGPHCRGAIVIYKRNLSR